MSYGHRTNNQKQQLQSPEPKIESGSPESNHDIRGQSIVESVSLMDWEPNWGWITDSLSGINR